MLATAWSLTSLVLIVLAADALGRPLARAWPITSPRSSLNPPAWTLLAWRICLGLVAAGCLLTVLAFVGLLHVWLIQILTAFGAAIGAAGWLAGSVYLGAPWDRQGSVAGSTLPLVIGRPLPGSESSPWLQRALAALFAAAALGSLVVALAPPVDGDALCYHLALPKYYLEAGGFRHLPYHDNSTFPLLIEMLFAWGLALDGGVTAQLIHWLFGLLLAGATCLLALDVFASPSGAGQGNRDAEGWAMVAAAVAVLTPAVTNQMTAALNDLALAVFTTFALVAWRQATWPDGQVSEAGTQSEAGWSACFVAAGIMAGAALATKYLALLFGAAMGVLWLAQLVWHRAGRKKLIAGAAVVAVVAAGVAGPWYARAAALRGNPVYPFFGAVFGTSGPKTDRPDKRPLQSKPADIAVASWRMTMQPEAFGGRGNQLGVLFLAAVPGVLLVRRLPRLWPLLGVAAVYVMLWYTMRQNLRFLVPVVPLLAVAVAAAWQAASRFGGLPGWLISMAALAALAFNTAQAVGRARGEVAVALGLESREDYLARHEPTYPAAAFAASQLPPDARILSQDYRQFHFPCEVTQESVFRRETDYPDALSDGTDLADQLAAAGFTHLLLMDVRGSKIRHSTKLSRLVEAATKSAADEEAAAQDEPPLRTLLEYEHREPGGERRRYRLVEIAPSTIRR